MTLERSTGGENTLRVRGHQAPDGRANLAWKAAETMQREFGCGPVAIDLTKRIPIAAGLAGGSADAAAVLAGMDALFALGVAGTDRLGGLAASLGSDVPFMLTGGKLGDIWGSKRAFRIGLIIYAIGTTITAVAPTIGFVVLGWSILEGLGSALIVPAINTLVRANYQGSKRASAYGVLFGVAAAGAAFGPLMLLPGILGDFMRVVPMVVVIALAIFQAVRRSPRTR